MGQDTPLLHTPFGIIRDARPSDTDSIVQLVGKLAAHHGDDAALTSGAASEPPSLMPARPRRKRYLAATLW